MKLPAFLSEERAPSLLGMVRVGLSALLLVFTIRLGNEYLDVGYFGDVFHLPLLPEALVPSSTGYGWLLACQALLGVLGLSGVLARPALLIAALCGLYITACDRLQYHNNRYTLLLLTLLVAMSPCDRSFRFGRAESHAPAPRWAAYLLGAQLSLVYLSSSVSKLLDSDWRDGTVLTLRFSPFRGLVEQWGPDRLAAWLAEPWFGQVAAAAAIGTELLLALGPWFSRTRVLALWLGVMFHLGIELFANVHLFSYTMLCGYVVFATPELRERRLCWSQNRAARALAEVLARLDVLARFRHETLPEQHALVIAYDRQGQAHVGLGALREVARAIPVLFPLWLPLSLLTWRRDR